MHFGVTMIAQVFYPSVGGAQTHTLRLSQKLRAQGVDVTVITRHHKGLKRYEEIDGVPTFRVGNGDSNKVVAALSFIAGSLNVLRTQAHRYQIVHCHQMISPMTIGLIARALSKKRLVVNPHRSGPLGDIGILTLRRPFTGRPRISIARRLTDGFVCISPAVHQELADVGVASDRLWDIANGVDLAHFTAVDSIRRAELRRSLELPSGPLVMFAGRLVREKGINVLLNAWPAVQHQVSNAHLLIIGEGAKKTELQAQAKQLGLNQQVTFAPSCDDVTPYLQAADAFVLPSFAEGLPVALLEAMSVGLPCVATATSGSLQLISDRLNGRIAPIDNPDELALALIDSLTNTDAPAWGLAARQRVAESYSLDAVTKHSIEMYETLLGMRHAPQKLATQAVLETNQPVRLE